MDVNTGQRSDPSGWETLELFAAAPAFNRWLFDRIFPFCKGQILEIGSGIGNISSLLLEHHLPASLSDLRPEYCRHLQKTFISNPYLQGVHQIDLSSPDLEKLHPELINRFDTVIALNVVEHIEEDSRAIQNAKKLLRKDGNLIILVPAGKWLYNRFDHELGHFRRYSGRTLSALLTGAGLTVNRVSYFNFAGMAGWWFSGSVLKEKIIPHSQLKLFDQLVPVFRVLDRFFVRVAGLSVTAVATKTSS